MIKRILLVFVFLIIPFSVFAEKISETHDLKIKAYKVNSSSEPFLNLFITDSITDGNQLNTIQSENQTINLDPFVESGAGDLVGPLPSGNMGAGDIAYGRMVFSYRVESNYEGTFEIVITIPPFALTPATEEESYIDAYYELQNKSLGFNADPVSTSATTVNGTTTVSTKLGDYELSYIAGIETEKTENGKSAVLTSSWIVSDGNNETTNGLMNETWLAREAVFAVIDETSYENAVTGTYHTNVTVNLTVGD